MNKKLVIVESPAKSKTIRKYLGEEDYLVLASYGHVRDLLPKNGSVEPKNQFKMHYQLIDGNVKHISAILKALKKCDTLLLATDLDREGEAISWHLLESLRERNALKGVAVKRVVFYQITRNAVQQAIENPRELSMDLVNAQQARRALDYLVGFNLSPLLWKKIRRGLSAGRVQSPALRLIVERELEIEAFKTQEYWTLLAQAQTASQIPEKIEARLVQFEHKKVAQFTFTNESQTKIAQKILLDAAKGELFVSAIDKKQRKRNPAAPFITSTLQQEAVRKLNFTARKTMQIAQQLYEGIEIGTGTVGLITYMRTDSVHLANEAIDEIRGYIAKNYGVDCIPKTPRIFKTKSKNAQEAHEAIRPTGIKRTPKQVKAHLSTDQFKLYDLIWKRAVASQMIQAILDTVRIVLDATSAHQFRATGSTISVLGFMQIYLEGTDDCKADEDEKLLPVLNVGDCVLLKDVAISQHFTDPPPRYSEASLVKALEEFGIGRPSTYATIIYTLQQREYVLLEKKRFTPTDVGRIVNKFLTEYFNNYVDYDFTAKLEDSLDSVACGEKNWIFLLDDFWQPFIDLVHKIDGSVARKDVTTEMIEDKCPQCNKPLTIRLGKRGRFVGCSAFPECNYTANVNASGALECSERMLDRVCPKCQHGLVIKSGRYGKFIGCSHYPNCKHIEPLEKPEDSGVACPMCYKGRILKRKSRREKIFYACSAYPNCNYALWNEPLDEPCPKCAWPILTVRHTKRKGAYKFCPRDECKYSVALVEV